MKKDEAVSRYADMFGALGSEQRLAIVRLLLAAHPDGMVVNELQEELEIAGLATRHAASQRQLFPALSLKTGCKTYPERTS